MSQLWNVNYQKKKEKHSLLWHIEKRQSQMQVFEEHKVEQ